MVSPDITHALTSMQPGTHTALIYDSAENKRDVLFRHLSCGQSDSKMVYVCSEEEPSQIREEMQEYGMDVENLERGERLVISNYEDVYIKNNAVDIEAIIDGFAKLSWDCKSHNLNMRAAAEMSCFFKRGKLVELVEYERALGKQFYFPGRGMCAFNVLEMQGAGCLDMLMPLLRAHGPVILTGPKGAVMLQSEAVKERHVEQVLEVRVP